MGSSARHSSRVTVDSSGVTMKQQGEEEDDGAQEEPDAKVHLSSSAFFGQKRK